MSAGQALSFLPVSYKFLPLAQSLFTAFEFSVYCNCKHLIHKEQYLDHGSRKYGRSKAAAWGFV